MNQPFHSQCGTLFALLATLTKETHSLEQIEPSIIASTIHASTVSVSYQHISILATVRSILGPRPGHIEQLWGNLTNLIWWLDYGHRQVELGQVMSEGYGSILPKLEVYLVTFPFIVSHF